MGDHGVRKVDYELGRFTTIDPLWEKYYAWSPYQYSMNNPISLADWNGLYAGDAFDNVEAALKDFATIYNTVSWHFAMEVGSRIYKYKDSDGNAKFTYGIPVMQGMTSTDTRKSESPVEGAEFVASVHTHPSIDGVTKEEETFSGTDIESIKEDGVKGYISTYTGKIKEYDPEIGGDDSGKTIMTGLPNQIFSIRFSSSNTRVFPIQDMFHPSFEPNRPVLLYLDGTILGRHESGPSKGRYKHPGFILGDIAP